MKPIPLAFLSFPDSTQVPIYCLVDRKTWNYMPADPAGDSVPGLFALEMSCCNYLTFAPLSTMAPRLHSPKSHMECAYMLGEWLWVYEKRPTFHQHNLFSEMSDMTITIKLNCIAKRRWSLVDYLLAVPTIARQNQLSYFIFCLGHKETYQRNLLGEMGM